MSRGGGVAALVGCPQILVYYDFSTSVNMPPTSGSLSQSQYQQQGRQASKHICAADSQWIGCAHSYLVSVQGSPPMAVANSDRKSLF